MKPSFVRGLGKIALLLAISYFYFNKSESKKKLRTHHILSKDIKLASEKSGKKANMVLDEGKRYIIYILI